MSQESCMKASLITLDNEQIELFFAIKYLSLILLLRRRTYTNGVCSMVFNQFFLEYPNKKSTFYLKLTLI